MRLSSAYREALALDQAAGDEDNAAVDLGLLGIVAWLSGRLDEAEKLCQQALARQMQSKDWSNMATTLLTLASVAEARGNTQEATGYRERASLAERRVNLKPGHVGNKYEPFPDLYGRFQAIQQLSDLVAVVGGGIVSTLRWLGGRGGKPANAASPLTDPARARAAARRYVFRFGTVVGFAALALGGLCVVVSLFVHDLSSSWLGITVAIILVCILVLVLPHPAFAAFIVASQTRFRDGVYAGLFAGVIVAAGGGGIFGMLDALRHPRSAMVVHLLVGVIVDVLLYVGVFVLIWLIPSLALALVGSLLGDKSR